MIKILISKALLCIANIGCYPVLVGYNTPVGTYTMNHVILENSGVRDDVIMLKYSAMNRIIAIHKPPTPTRYKLLEEQSKEKVTMGCINVTPELFDYLVETYNGTDIEITN